MSKRSNNDDETKVAERMLSLIFKDHQWTSPAARARCIALLVKAEKLVLVEIIKDSAAAKADRLIKRVSTPGKPKAGFDPVPD